MPRPLGALDLCRTSHVASPADILWGAVELVRSLERLGYTRYWLPEHHESDSAQACPEIMTAVLSGVTDSIRIGSAGILLRYYSAVKVAETFKLLNTIYPDRIDLGIAGGQAANPATHQQLALDAATDVEYLHKLHLLIDALGNPSNTGVPPIGGTSPQLWIMGAGTRGAALAASLGVGFCHGLSSPSTRDEPSAIMEHYRDRFASNTSKRGPAYAVAIAGVCAESDALAKQLARQETIYSASIVGAPSHCAEQIERMADDLQADEVIFIDLCREVRAKIRSYQLIASALNLSSVSAPGQPS